MVKKKSPTKKTTTKAKKPAVTKNKVKGRSYFVKLMLAFIFVPLFGYIAFNLYLDNRNVHDMKELLANIEQLERSLEDGNNKEFFIETECSSGGKFATFYSCNLVLKTPIWQNNYSETVKAYPKSNFEKEECSILSEHSIGFESEDDRYICSFLVRPSNKSSSVKIFAKYFTN